jgi:hypothetical protein
MIEAASITSKPICVTVGVLSRTLPISVPGFQHLYSMVIVASARDDSSPEPPGATA